MSGPPSFKDGGTLASHEGYETPSAGCSTTTDTPATLHGTPGSSAAALDSLFHYRNHPPFDHSITGMGVPFSTSDGREVFQPPPVPPSATSFLAMGMSTGFTTAPSSLVSTDSTGGPGLLSDRPQVQQRRFNPSAAPFVPAALAQESTSYSEGLTAIQPPMFAVGSSSSRRPTTLLGGGLATGVLTSSSSSSAASLYIELRGPKLPVVGFSSPVQWSDELSRWAALPSDVTLDITTTTGGNSGRASCLATIRPVQREEDASHTIASRDVSAAVALLLSKSGSNIHSQLCGGGGPMTVVVERLVLLRLSGWEERPSGAPNATEKDEATAKPTFSEAIAQQFAELCGLTYVDWSGNAVGAGATSAAVKETFPTAVMLHILDSQRVFACEWSRCLSLSSDRRSLVPGTDIVVEVVS